MKFSRVIQSLIVRFKLIQLSVRLGTPFLTARLALLMSKAFDTGSQFNILCLGRPIFNEDINELAKQASTLNYIVVPKIVFITIFNQYLSCMPIPTMHTDYHKAKDFQDEKQKYRSFLKSFIVEFSKIAHVDAVLAANYVYAWQQELAVVCNEIKIPFVVLFKEGISPVFKKGVAPEQAHGLVVSTYTNNKFIGEKILVYNENIRNAFINSNIEGVNKEVVETVGIPRMDRYFQLENQGENIIFFSFYLEDKIRHLNLDEVIFNAYLDKQKKFHIEVMKYAKFYPTHNVVIKTKNNNRYMEYVKKIAEENGYSDLSNLVITNTGNVYEHIKNSFAVIGYNSTALLEGFAARRLIITPDFRDGIISDFFEEYPNLANYVNSMEDINSVITSKAANESINGELKSLLHDRIYIPDGHACKRTEVSIRNTINTLNNKN